jgi:hypothetical protein
MLTHDHHDSLLLAHRHGVELRAAADAERFPSTSAARRLLARSLRRLADHLDRAAAVRTPAGQC